MPLPTMLTKYISPTLLPRSRLSHPITPSPPQAMTLPTNQPPMYIAQVSEACDNPTTRPPRSANTPFHCLHHTRTIHPPQDQTAHHGRRARSVTSHRGLPRHHLLPPLDPLHAHRPRRLGAAPARSHTAGLSVGGASRGLCARNLHRKSSAGHDALDILVSRQSQGMRYSLSIHQPTNQTTNWFSQQPLYSFVSAPSPSSIAYIFLLTHSRSSLQQQASVFLRESSLASRPSSSHRTSAYRTAQGPSRKKTPLKSPMLPPCDETARRARPLLARALVTLSGSNGLRLRPLQPSQALDADSRRDYSRRLFTKRTTTIPSTNTVSVCCVCL